MYYLRTWTLTALLLDTGCRVGEALSLTMDGVDFQNLLLIVIKTMRPPAATKRSGASGGSGGGSR